jgi:hypothetical protein
MTTIVAAAATGIVTDAHDSNKARFGGLCFSAGASSADCCLLKNAAGGSGANEAAFCGLHHGCVVMRQRNRRSGAADSGCCVT